MVALGKPYKIIAQEFSLRQATIRAHVSNILSELRYVPTDHNWFYTQFTKKSLVPKIAVIVNLKSVAFHQP